LGKSRVWGRRVAARPSGNYPPTFQHKSHKSHVCFQQSAHIDAKEPCIPSRKSPLLPINTKPHAHVGFLYLHMYLSMYLHMYLSMYLGFMSDFSICICIYFMHLCMYASMYLCAYVCIYAFAYACIYVRIYASFYLCINVYIHINVYLYLRRTNYQETIYLCINKRCMRSGSCKMAEAALQIVSFYLCVNLFVYQ